MTLSEALAASPVDCVQLDHTSTYVVVDGTACDTPGGYTIKRGRLGDEPTTLVDAATINLAYTLLTPNETKSTNWYPIGEEGEPIIQ